MEWSQTGERIALVAAPEPIQLSRHVVVPNLAANFRILIVNANSGEVNECPDHDLQVMPGRASWLSRGRIAVLAGTKLHAELVIYHPMRDRLWQATNGGYVTVSDMTRAMMLVVLNWSSGRGHREQCALALELAHAALRAILIGDGVLGTRAVHRRSMAASALLRHNRSCGKAPRFSRTGVMVVSAQC